MLSTAVIAMSNLPSASPVICATELGVNCSITRIPFRSKNPLSSATKLGQLKPPGKTFTVMWGSSSERTGAHAMLVRAPKRAMKATRKKEIFNVLFIQSPVKQARRVSFDLEQSSTTPFDRGGGPAPKLHPPATEEAIGPRRP